MPDLNETAFNLHLSCGNCSHEWTHPVPVGHKVFERNWTRDHLKIAEESITGGVAGDAEHIQCPNCETYTQVDVEDKEPLTE